MRIGNRTRITRNMSTDLMQQLKTWHAMALQDKTEVICLDSNVITMAKYRLSMLAY